jgi:hypothetical protein
MAVHLETSDPSGLLAAIRKAIDDDKVKTWTYDKDGDFTHTAAQWKNRAWMRPHILGNELRLNIIAPLNTTLSVSTYAIYHGRFIEMMLAHCDRLFTSAAASAQAEAPDRIRS